MGTGTIILIVMAAGSILLMPFRWFWKFVFGLGALTALFAMATNLTRYQIDDAIGCFLIMAICGTVYAAIAMR